MALHNIILAALDSAIVESEWEVADKLLGAMEALCRDNELDARLAQAYIRIDRVCVAEPLDESDLNTVPQIILQSALTCPHCGFRKEEAMPTDACQYFYECTSCKTLLKPKSGDCCVFCSFGSVKCPPIQQQQSCCR